MSKIVAKSEIAIIQVEDGTDGQSSYLYTAWANNSTGSSGFSTTVSANKLYIGTYTDTNPVQSTTPSKYNWVKIKGEGVSSSAVHYVKSASGTVTPAANAGWSTSLPTPTSGQYLWTRVTLTFTDGSTNESYSVSYYSVSVERIDEYYKLSTSNVTPPTGTWDPTPSPTTTTDKYLWNYEVIVYSDGSSTPTSKRVISTHGATGATGAEGRAITGVTNYYLVDSKTTGITTSDSRWSTTPGVMTPTDKYLWNYEKISYSKAPLESTTTPTIIGAYGQQGIQGPAGTNGQSQYVHIRYSANSNGNPMTTSPQATTKYIGIANTTSSTAPSGYDSYTWSKYIGDDGARGPQGIQGPAGANGQPTYTWVKYADTPTSGMNDFPDGKKYIGLAFNKTTQTEGTNYDDYQWSLMPQNITVGGRNYLLNSGERVYFEEQDVIPTTVEEYLPTEGGRNLILDSNEFRGGSKAFGIHSSVMDGLLEVTVERLNGNWSTTWFSSTSQANFHRIENSFSEGEDFTISLTIRGVGEVSGKPTVYIKSGMGYHTMIGNVTNDWSILYYTGTWKKDNAIYPHLGWSRAEGTFQIKNWKIEKGDNPNPTWTPAPEDFNNLKGKSYALSQPLRNENILSLNGSFEEDDFIGLWLGSDKFVGFLDNQELTFDLTENYDDEFVVVKTLSEKGIINNAKLEKGNTLTDWTPAPEDVQNEITRVETETTAKITTNSEAITLEKSERETQYGTLEDTVKTQYATISLVDNAITNEVTAREELGGALQEEISSQVQQTVDSFNVIFNKIEADQNLTNDEVALIQSYFRINENGVIIGKTDSAIEFFAENNRVGFRENGNDIAYWEEGTMHVDRLIAVTTIMVGYHLIEKYDSSVAGNTTIVRLGD